MKLSLTLFALASTVFAHFQLQYPHSLGFDDAVEGNGPCGGYTVPSPLASDANSTNATIDSFAIALLTTHPQSTWLFRATVSSEQPYNWTDLLPTISQTSIGEFCIPNLKAPSDFAGKTGLIQVIGDAVDGFLYQCAVVNFISGANTTIGSTCTNATGLTATFTSQNFTTNSNGSVVATGSSTASSASSTSTHSAAAIAVQNGGFLATVFAVLSVVLML